MAEAVHLIDRYDLWLWENVEGALEFQMGLKRHDTDPSEKEFWKKFLKPSSGLQWKRNVRPSFAFFTKKSKNF